METWRGWLLTACGRRVEGGREGEREEGYKDNFLSALIALTVCRLLPSWRSLIEITCTKIGTKKELLWAGRWRGENKAVICDESCH